MTTITVDKALLEQAREALWQTTKHFNFIRMHESRLRDSEIRVYAHDAMKALEAALSAPATAPVPAWHDAPTVPGLWVSDFSWMAQKLDRDTVEFYAKSNSIPNRRWYGPIPEDKS